MFSRFRLHRNGSTRLFHYDYSRNGYYFVTICVKPRMNFFGNIKNGIMQYNNLGYVAAKYWSEIPDHFSFVTSDEFIVMPDHVHGIICINKPYLDVGAQNFARLQKQPMPHENMFGPQSKNLGSIIRGYKIAVTKYANENNIPFDWQPRYYDRIIRNERELNNIRRYIRNNPIMWHN